MIYEYGCGKRIKTYSIDSMISEKFDKLAKELNLNKSSFIEGKIWEFICSNPLPTKKIEIEDHEYKEKLSYESKYRIVEKQFEDRSEFTPEVTYIDKEVNISVGGKKFNDDWHSVVFLNGNMNQNEWVCKTKEEAEQEIEKWKNTWLEYTKSQNLIKEIIHEL